MKTLSVVNGVGTCMVLGARKVNKSVLSALSRCGHKKGFRSNFIILPLAECFESNCSQNQSDSDIVY